MEPPVHPEIGRELKASELQEGTVIIGIKDCGHNHAATIWVIKVMPAYVILYAGEVGLNVVLVRTPEDTLVDDTGAQVHTYEYLGEI